MGSLCGKLGKCSGLVKCYDARGALNLVNVGKVSYFSPVVLSLSTEVVENALQPYRR